MRFTIRDLLWLMVVVALGSSILTDGLSLRRLMARHKQESAIREREHALALAEFQAGLKSWQHQNMLLHHQIVVLLEKMREQETGLAARSQNSGE